MDLNYPRAGVAAGRFPRSLPQDLGPQCPDARVAAPRHPDSAGPVPGDDGRGSYATTGIGPDLMQGAKAAVRALVDHLVQTHRLSRQDAYVLCSVAADLKISEIVDQPNWIVSAYLPMAIFTEAYID